LPSRYWRSAAAAVFLVVLAAVSTHVVHRETLQYGFHYDDYSFIRPYPAAEVLASFHGPWDRSGIHVPFYRPLTIAFHAARFELFGLNAQAHHRTSLILFALAASLVGWLAYRFTSQLTVAAAATLVFVCHPAMPYSLVTWITNQMHLLQILVVLSALAWWDAVRTRRVAWWLPLLLFGAASFLVKEDGIMLLPGIVALHTLRRLVAERDLPHVPWQFMALAAIVAGLLIALRFQALGALGGYGRPSPALAWARISGSLSGVYRLVPPDRDWQPLASMFSTYLPLVSLLAVRWISPGARFCLLGGATVAILFALPFAFAAKPEQVYMLGCGMSFVLAGAFAGLLDLAGKTRVPRAARVAVAALFAAGLTTFAIVARDIDRDFAPFGPMVLSQDAVVHGWPVAPEIRDYLARKRESAAGRRISTNPIDELTHVSFGVMGPEVSPDGVSYVWMAGPRVEIHVTARASVVTIPVRHEIGAFREPARLRIAADGRPADDLVLDDARWRVSTIALAPTAVPRLSRMHRLVLAIDHAWRPSEVIPGSTDERILGLQIGAVSIR
jgi:Dolichyl-phosphate-mannose-protein mannosyltransferase